MEIRTEDCSVEHYSQLINGYRNITPLWLLPEFITCYKEKLLLVTFRGRQVVGFWAIPIVQDNGKIMAKRPYRFFPYTSPLLVDTGNLKKREVVYSLFESICQQCSAIYLPIDPHFPEISLIQGSEAVIELRHTHILSSLLNLKNVGSRLRNHINFARKEISVITHSNVETFKFDLAIKGNEQETVERKSLASKLLAKGSAIIFSARKNGKTVAEMIVMFDHQTAYLLHSWQNPDAPRGSISLLIYEAANWTYNVKRLRFFDFEGSVINDIDYFFCGFNAEVTPYGFLHWGASRQDTVKLVDRSITILKELNEVKS